MSLRPGKPPIRHFVTILLASAALAACGSPSANPFQADDPAVQEARGLRLEPKQVDPAALKAKVSDEPARKFYEARGWQAAWDETTAGGLLAALGDSERHALSKASFLKLSPDRKSVV